VADVNLPTTTVTIDANKVITAHFVDITLPDTTITAYPPDPSISADASFSFTSTEPGSTFECQLDGSGFSACTSPKTYTGLADGTHTFEVRAIDASSNVDPSPASYSWTIDTVAPNTTITAHPDNPSHSVDASFSFTSTEPGSTFECQLDGGGFSTCTSPQTYTGLDYGNHTFEVRAIDGVGNPDPTPASYSWTITKWAVYLPIVKR
jgi:large repetitive protein